jgi:hypothetical protein
MARVTDSEVLAIVDTQKTDLSPFIAVATALVDQLDDACLDEPMKKEIERWLAAHFVTISDGVVQRDKIGDAEVWYNVANLGQGLKHTRFGQQAILLDCSGLLARMGVRGAAKIETIVIEDYTTTV